MSSNRRQFKRPIGQRRYRKLFVISVEGSKTEPQYFAIFNDLNSVIHVNCLKGKYDSSPLHVLRRLQAFLKKEDLKVSDEAWIVVDKDQWTDEQLSQLHAWSIQSNAYGFALSNPKFEYWLLLHFEDGTGIISSGDCSDRLKRQLSDYDKGINARIFTIDRVHDAIRRAKIRDYPPCEDWPRNIGGTTIYKLVLNILKR